MLSPIEMCEISLRQKERTEEVFLYFFTNNLYSWMILLNTLGDIEKHIEKAMNVRGNYFSKEKIAEILSTRKASKAEVKEVRSKPDKASEAEVKEPLSKEVQNEPDSKAEIKEPSNKASETEVEEPLSKKPSDSEAEVKEPSDSGSNSNLAPKKSRKPYSRKNKKNASIEIASISKTPSEETPETVEKIL